MAVHSREEFKQYCLRRLGAPVINIEVDDTQVEDRIDDALKYYADYHFDGSEKTYLSYQLTAENIANKWLPVSDKVIGIVGIFPINSSVSTNSMFSAQYQMRLNDFFNISSASMAPYVSAMTNIATIQEQLVGQQPIRFNRHTDKLYLDMTWSRMNVGDYIIVDAYVLLDPDVYNEIWDDKWLKRYATALIAKQWGQNLAKFQGMQMPGGMSFDGQRILGDADAEIAKLEDEVISSYSPILSDMMG